MRQRRKEYVWMMAAVLALLMSCPPAAHAGVIKVWPDKFKPSIEGATYQWHAGHSLYSTGANTAVYWARVKIPAGKTITRSVYYHQSSGSPSCYTEVNIRYTPINEETISFAHQTHTSTSIELVPVELNLTAGHKVKKKYRYFAEVRVENATCAFKGMKIFYK